MEKKLLFEGRYWGGAFFCSILVLTIFAFVQCAPMKKMTAEKLITTFRAYISGDFDNEKQLAEERKAGNVVHPSARHVNRVCNQKIKNLPTDLKGFFLLEESYYQTVGKPLELKPYLFYFARR